MAKKEFNVEDTVKENVAEQEKNNPNIIPEEAEETVTVDTETGEVLDTAQEPSEYPVAKTNGRFGDVNKRDFGVGAALGLLLGLACYKLVDKAVTGVKTGIKNIKAKKDASNESSENR